MRNRLEQAAERQKRLKDEIKLLDQDRASINRVLIQTAKRAQQLEDDIFAQEQRLEEMSGLRNRLVKSLSSKRGLLAEVLGALQRMGRNPPPAILVRPEDALTSVRSSILLASVIPEIRDETAILVGELKALGEVTRNIEDEKNTLVASLDALAEDESRMAMLLQEKNARAKQSRAEQQEQARIVEDLASKARSLEELIGSIETRIEAAAKAAEAARMADEERRKAEAERLAKAREALEKGEVPQQPKLGPVPGDAATAFGPADRTTPAFALEETKGLLPRPVSGKLLYSFGESTSTSGQSRPNIAFTTRPNARVTSPADGWVVYAGPFRSYGHLVILNAGDGYRLVLTGMRSSNVATGQFVLAGEPIGQMGATRVASAASIDLSSTQPVLYVEFTKDKKSIDPLPWFASGLKKKDEE